MKRAILLLVAVLALGVPARADEQTQAVQQALKDQGFYYGEVDGQPGPETDAAVRRYQIRQGLDVTGKLDAQTLGALDLGPKDDNALHAVPKPAPAETQAPTGVVQSDHDFLRRQAPAAPAPAPPEEPAPQPAPPEEPAPPQPPQQAAEGQTLPAEYARFFRKTPYETAPPVVQRSTVQRAQERLARQGFYRGVADGELGDALGRALVAYQRDAELAPSGRLDLDTLVELNLLPRRRVVVRPAMPYEEYPPEGREVFRGIWVR